MNPKFKIGKRVVLITAASLLLMTGVVGLMVALSSQNSASSGNRIMMNSRAGKQPSLGPVRSFIVWIVNTCWDMTHPENRAEREAIEGSRMSVQEAGQLEADLTKHPWNPTALNKLLGFYNLRQFGSDADRKARQGHLLWLIANHPEAPILGTHYADLGWQLDEAAYAKGKELWLKQIKANPKNTRILDHAAEYFMFGNKSLAEDILLKLENLEPRNPRWPDKLAHQYALALRGNQKTDAAIAAKALAELERAQSNTKDEEEKFNRLDDLSKVALAGGQVEKARNWANQILAGLGNGKNHWNPEDMKHRANIVLGRIALREGKVDLAKKHLLEAGKITGSPVLGSFGPNMMLARELLEKRERKVVLEYFELCKKFWSPRNGELDQWTKEVKQGKIPSFGSNLDY